LEPSGADQPKVLAAPIASDPAEASAIARGSSALAAERAAVLSNKPRLSEKLLRLSGGLLGSYALRARGS
jgi:hypothetical protein